IILCLFGIIPNLQYTRFVGDTHIRYSLGTIYPTVFGSFIFFLLLQYTYLKESLNYKNYLFILLVTLLTNFLTDNRLVTVLLLLLILFRILISNKRIIDFLRVEKYKKFFLLFSFIPLILILYLSITYDDTSQVYLTLNKLLSGRLRISYSGFKEYGISLLGKRLPIIGYGGNVAEPISDYFYLDSLPV